MTAGVRQTGDSALVRAAEGALAKLVATLREPVHRQALHAVLQVYRHEKPPKPPAGIRLVRGASWDERALDIGYADAEGRLTHCCIHPLSIVLLDRSRMPVAWCCLRQDFRKFMLQRIASVAQTDESVRPRRVPLLRDFLARMRAGATSAAAAP